MNLRPVVIAITIYLILIAAEMIVLRFTYMLFLLNVYSFNCLPKVLVSIPIMWTPVNFSGVFENKKGCLP